jgi:hypothetical protein
MYLQRRRSRDAGGAGAPLFPAWDLDGMALHKSKPLTNGAALAKRLRLRVTALLTRFPKIGVNPAAYGMHSLRRGGMMAAWDAGIDLERIKLHGRVA